MKNVRLGRTEIIVPQNAFGCLPIQRDTTEVAVKLLREAYDGGMRFFDTARAYSDSEEKVCKNIAAIFVNLTSTSTMSNAMLGASSFLLICIISKIRFLKAYASCLSS